MKNREEVSLPGAVLGLLQRLEAGGFEAFAVGGCVRDSLLGKEPGDWDIATNALPEETAACFAGNPLVLAGVRHGTVGVKAGEAVYEITTYRIDGAYSDRRRPDTVRFAAGLAEDLSRRDFTINAMAYHPRTGLVDRFGGREDLRRGRIACVGSPRRRFEEDALRLLRAFRFACVLGFAVEEETAREMIRSVRLLRESVSRERICSELGKALLGKGVGRALRETACREVLAAAIPELEPLLCDGKRWERVAAAVASAPRKLPARLALLLQFACLPGKAGGYGYAKRSARIAGEVLQRLRCDRATLRETVFLVRRCHMRLRPGLPCVCRMLYRWGREPLESLLELQQALPDPSLQGPARQTGAALERIRRENRCWSLPQLAVGGDDLIALGFAPGRRLGDALEELLFRVMEGKLQNTRTELLEYAACLCEPGYAGGSV